MLRTFLSHRFCTRCSLPCPRECPLMTPRTSGARARLLSQTQRRFVGGPAFSKYRSKSTIWMCGVGVGVALAVGLKCSFDSADSFKDENVRKAEKTDRYSSAIKVSRDLVERIKVGTEVGQVCLLFFFVLIYITPKPSVLTRFMCVVRLKLELLDWQSEFLWTALRSGAKVGESHAHCRSNLFPFTGCMYTVILNSPVTSVSRSQADKKQTEPQFILTLYPKLKLCHQGHHFLFFFFFLQTLAIVDTLYDSIFSI